VPRIPQSLIDADANRVRPDRAEPVARFDQDDARTDHSGRWSTYVRAASPRQMNFIRNLINERDWSGLTDEHSKHCQALASDRVRILTDPEARTLIDALLAAPRLANHNRKATPAQIDRVKSLAAELGMNPGDLSELGFDVASKMIDKLKEKALEKRRSGTRRITEDGLYRTPDGVVYKVQVAVHGSGQLYAKKLAQFEDGSWEFVRDPSGMSKIRPEMKMTLEQAQEFGRLYGICARCGATLTDEESIEYGIGPICRSKF